VVLLYRGFVVSWFCDLLSCGLQCWSSVEVQFCFVVFGGLVVRCFGGSVVWWFAGWRFAVYWFCSFVTCGFVVLWV